MRARFPLILFALIAATPAAAQLRAVPTQPASEVAALRGVDVFLLNEGPAAVDAEGPREIEVTAADGTKLILERTPAPQRTIAPGGYARLRYVPVGVAGVAVPPGAATPPAAMADAGETVVPTATGSSSAFLDRFAPHEPIYAVMGTGDAGAKIQFSFGFRPFAQKAPLHLGSLRFAYTQTMFWAVQEPSGPFKSTNYSPEVYADLPISDSLGVAVGYRHDSNGRGTATSVDANRIFLRVGKRFELGGDWRVEVAPQVWFFVGEKGIATDLADYWGYSSLTASIQKKDGIKIAVTGRGSFTTGRGSGEVFVSYPLARLGGLDLYLFGQAYTGFGEALDNYRVSDTHARLGIALTR